jgi:retron-type reverse transcriptase
MKRQGELLAAIADPENLRLAFWKASKGKRAKADCLVFREHLETNLDTLRAELLGGRVRVGDYHYFTIHDPKQRTICAAHFRERVLHHALMNVCEPVLERAAVFDSYACRKGKGQLAAVRRAQCYAERFGWFLKMDIRKYFDSVDHTVLRGLLRRKLKDAVVLGLFDQVLASYQTTPGHGLPIGNLTSQHFANFYLAPLDRFIKERLRRTAYVRYMDDFVVWGQSVAELRAVWRAVNDFLAAELHLALKPNASLNRTTFGMDFLGYRIFPHELRLARRSKLRFARKFRRYEGEWMAGRWTELELQQRMQALVAFTLPACSRSWRRHVMDRFACLPRDKEVRKGTQCARRRQGVVANGLEPRDSRRQLEQQRQELPVSEPQQQQPGEQEQQYRVPGCPGPSSIPQGGTDPAIILSLECGVPGQIAVEQGPV